MASIVIVGAGGFAREVAWLIEDINEVRTKAGEEPYRFMGHIVSDLASHHDPDTAPVGDYTWLRENAVDCCAIGIGTPAVRLKVADELSSMFPHLQWPALIHPSVRYQRATCKFGQGAIVCANNVFTVNVELKPFCMVNLSCTIGHEAIIGEGSVLNPSVNVSGGAVIGKAVLVGTGAQILQYVKIGDGATVGSSAMVHREVPPDVTVIGVPAKAMPKAPSA